MSDSVITRTVPGVAATVESFLDDAANGRVSLTDLHRVQKAAHNAILAKTAVPETLTPGRASPKRKDLPKPEKRR